MLPIMERSLPPRPSASAASSAGDHRAWWLLLLALLAWQGWMTLTLFGVEQPGKHLLDDWPILSGRHPLHLYHGYLGARALRERGNLSCYDPTFHAGYPKTPVFDSGSRPAELMLIMAGGRYCPAAYKIGLALMCLSAPLLLFVAGRGVGLHRAWACLACLLGQLVWWGQPCRDALEAGEFDLLLASLLVVAQAGLLIRYHEDAGPLNWLGVVGAAVLGWFAHPLLMLLLLPVVLIYYLSVGTRHRLAWHLALLGGLLAAAAANSFFLIDWIGYWWIRMPPPLATPLLADATLQSLWQAPLWGGPVDKALACTLSLTALLGVLLYNQSGRRATARLFGLAWIGFLSISVAALLSEPLGRFGAHRLLTAALLFAVPLAAHALSVAARLVWRWRSTRAAGILAVLAIGLFLGRSPPSSLVHWAARLRGTQSFQIGLDENQRAIVETLRKYTTPQARILWEDIHAGPQSPHWTPLLARLTERAYIGGLDADAGIEYAANGLVDALLMGKPITERSDEELRLYCRRYNIGWIACWSPSACQRFRRWKKAEMTAALPPCNAGEPPGCLFTIQTQHASFALAGTAEWLSADTRRIVLGDVIPQRTPADSPKGYVLLSLHYQAGMRVAPSRVHMDSYTLEIGGLSSGPTPPFVRLWVEEPVTRVTITWDKK